MNRQRSRWIRTLESTNVMCYRYRLRLNQATLKHESLCQMNFLSLISWRERRQIRAQAFTCRTTRFSLECLETRRLLVHDVAVMNDPDSTSAVHEMDGHESNSALVSQHLENLQGSSSAASTLLDNNLKVVDLIGDLPLNVDSTTQILWHSEAWEQNNPTLGFTTIVKNDRGQNPDNKYYLYYAHHDPESGIGVAVADTLTGPYTKISPPDSRVLVASGGSPNQHLSTPSVVWNEDT